MSSRLVTGGLLWSLDDVIVSWIIFIFVAFLCCYQKWLVVVTPPSLCSLLWEKNTFHSSLVRNSEAFSEHLWVHLLHAIVPSCADFWSLFSSSWFCSAPGWVLTGPCFLFFPKWHYSSNFCLFVAHGCGLAFCMSSLAVGEFTLAAVIRIVHWEPATVCRFVWVKGCRAL